MDWLARHEDLKNRGHARARLGPLGREPGRAGLRRPHAHRRLGRRHRDGRLRAEVPRRRPRASGRRRARGTPFKRISRFDAPARPPRGRVDVLYCGGVHYDGLVVPRGAVYELDGGAPTPSPRSPPFSPRSNFSPVGGGYRSFGSPANRAAAATTAGSRSATAAFGRRSRDGRWSGWHRFFGLAHRARAGGTPRRAGRLKGSPGSARTGLARFTI